MRHRICTVALIAVISTLPLAAQRVPPPVVIKNVTLIDGTGKLPQTNVSIVLLNGRVDEIGAKVSAPDKAQIIDGTGKYVIPGLIDLRVQISSSPASRFYRGEVGEEQRVAWMHAMVGAGVTQARLVQGDLEEQKYFKHWRDLDLLNGPEIITSGPTFTAEGGSPATEYPVLGTALRRREVFEVANVDQAREKSRTVAHGGSDVFEVVYDSGPDIAPYQRLTNDAFTTIVDEAHGHELKVFCWVSHNQEALKAIEAGVEVIEGASEDVLSDEVLAAMVKKNVAFEPVLVEQGDVVNRLDPQVLKAYLDQPLVALGLSPVIQKSLAREADRGSAIAQVRDAMNEKVETPASRKEKEKQQEAKENPKAGHNLKDAEGDTKEEDRPTIRTLLQKQQERARENVRRAKAAGVRIVLGTGAGSTLNFPGASAHREMELLTKAGLSPMEAIIAATNNAATLLGKGDAGTVERGKWADLVLLDADPLTDITNTTKINTVVRSGHMIHAGDTDVY